MVSLFGAIFFNFYCGTSKSNLLTKDGRKRLLIDKFEYNEDKKLKPIASGLSHTLTNELSRVESLEVIGPAEKNSVLKALKEKQMYGEEVDPTEFLTKLTAADYYCNGDVQIEDKTALVNVRISDAKKGSLVLSTSSKGNIDKPITLQEKIVTNLLSNIDEKEPDSNESKINQTSTKNEAAYSHYAEGSSVLYTDPKQAAVLFISALKKDPEYIDAIEDLANSLYQVGDLKSSLKYMQLKKEILEKRNLKETVDYANTLCNIGVIQFNLGNKKEAIALCFQDKEIKESLRITKTKAYANTVQTLGSFYLVEGNYTLGISHLNQSRIILNNLGLDKSLDHAELLITLGSAYRQTGDYQSAENAYIEADSLFGYLGITNTSSYASLMGNMGLLQLAQRNYKESLKKFIKDKEIQDKLGLTNTQNYVTTLNNLSTIFNELGLKDKAQQYSKISQEIAKKLQKNP